MRDDTMRRNVWVIIALVQFLLCWMNVYAQGDSSYSPTGTPIVAVVKSTDTTSPPAQEKTSGSFHPAKSPLLAMGLSAVFPGLGQLYDANYWKAPVIWGVGGYWVYVWIDLNRQYKDFQRLYSLTGSDRYLSLRNFYRDERDKYAWFMGALYLLNIVEAYAGAHLYDFNVSPDLSVSGMVTPSGAIALRVRF